MSSRRRGSGSFLSHLSSNVARTTRSGLTRLEDDESVGQQQQLVRAPVAIPFCADSESYDLLGFHDFSDEKVKPNSLHKPLWVCPDGHIFMEAFSTIHNAIEPFLIAIAEPISRPPLIHEFQITVLSLYSAISVGETVQRIIETLDKFSKNGCPPKLAEMITDHAKKFGKLKLLLQDGRYFIESSDRRVLIEALKNEKIRMSRCYFNKHAPQPLSQAAVTTRRTSATAAAAAAAIATATTSTTATTNYVNPAQEFILKKQKQEQMALLKAEKQEPGETQDAAAAETVLLSEESMMKRPRLEPATSTVIKPEPGTNQHEADEHILDENGIIIGRRATVLEEDKDDDHDETRNESNPVANESSTTTTTTAGDDNNNNNNNDNDSDKVPPIVSSDPLSHVNAGLTAGHIEALGGASLLLNESKASSTVKKRSLEDILASGPRKVNPMIEIREDAVKTVKEVCLKELQRPLLEEYDFRNDHKNKSMNIALKPTTKIRVYQEVALRRMFTNGRARSGIIVLPCGAGKTLVGIVAATTLRKSCLVLTSTSVAVEQWRRSFVNFTTVDPKIVRTFTADSKQLLPSSPDDPVILCSTYTMLAHAGKRSVVADKIARQIASREWGLLVLDEVQFAPAPRFRRVCSLVKSHCKLGLTATLVREDDLIYDLQWLIGPKLYEAHWLKLQEMGFLAKVQCVEVWCSMTAPFFHEYLRASAEVQRRLWVLNPNKIRVCEFLIRYHEQRGDKIIVFSDNLTALKETAVRLKKAMIYGEVSDAERMAILHKFQTDDNFNVIFLSRVGDNAIDIPCANVVIQISFNFASRRQEAQRLGRILRPKPRGADEFNAVFYSLLSRDTQELYYADRRQQFIIDQGYSYSIVREEQLPMDNVKLVFDEPKLHRDLLHAVLSNRSEDFEDVEQTHLNDLGLSSSSATGSAMGPSRGRSSGGGRVAPRPLTSAAATTATGGSASSLTSGSAQTAAGAAPGGLNLGDLGWNPLVGGEWMIASCSEDNQLMIWKPNEEIIYDEDFEALYANVDSNRRIGRYFY